MGGQQLAKRFSNFDSLGKVANDTVRCSTSIYDDCSGTTAKEFYKKARNAKNCSSIIKINVL